MIPSWLGRKNIWPILLRRRRYFVYVCVIMEWIVMSLLTVLKWKKSNQMIVKDLQLHYVKEMFQIDLSINNMKNTGLCGYVEMVLTVLVLLLMII